MIRHPTPALQILWLRITRGCKVDNLDLCVILYTYQLTNMSGSLDMFSPLARVVSLVLIWMVKVGMTVKSLVCYSGFSTDSEDDDCKSSACLKCSTVVKMLAVRKAQPARSVLHSGRR